MNVSKNVSQMPSAHSSNIVHLYWVIKQETIIDVMLAATNTKHFFRVNTFSGFWSI